jgi:hypothetical protein
LVAIALGALGCQQEQPEDPAEAAYSELRQAFQNTDDELTKATLAESYLTEFPDTGHTASMASTVAYYRGDRLDDPRGALEILQSALARIEDPGNRFEVSMAMVPLASELGQPIDLESIAGELANHRELEYGDHAAIMEAAEQAQQWSLALHHAEAALPFATEDAYRADYPDREMDDNEVAERAGYRLATAMAYKGWAMFNLGHTDDGLALLTETDEITPEEYLGLSTTPLDLFHARAVLASGEHERALDLLAPLALFGDSKTALPLLLKAYAEVHGSEEGIEQFLWSTRQRLAKSADDFTLPDYDGNHHTLSALGGKVVLLAFWFPT